MRAARGRKRVGVWLGSLLGVAGIGCSPAEPLDVLSERCVEVLQIRKPGLGALRRVKLDSKRKGVRTLRIEGRGTANTAGGSHGIDCGFAPGDRWALERIHVDGRALTETEVALVNSELLLRDLSEHPERLQESRAAEH